ncbi:MAG: T9SS type A sorting domain-containing protein [Flavobacteriaceae bacterium]|nr:T9SS type A sorting domain-containing protein [Flavobacteriaceae bacterium]
MLKNYSTLAFLFFFFFNNIYSQTTYVPDNNFEQTLIDLGYDDVLDDYVLTSNISGVILLDLGSKNISDLTGIEDFLSLEELDCRSNQLTSLDVSQNTALTALDCRSNQLTNLDVSQNTALSILSCLYNQITSLDVTQNTALISLYFNNNQLTSLDVSQNTILIKLGCRSNQLSSLDISKNTVLTDLYCDNNQLTSLDAKNGNNSLITTFNSQSNSTLSCIQVDNEIDANAGTGSYSTWNKDAIATYSEDCASLSLNDEFLAKSITFYPNPVSDILIIDSKIPLTKVEVYNILGQKVKEINSGFNSIPMDNLSNGIYIVRLQSEKGFATKKLIKKQ